MSNRFLLCACERHPTKTKEDASQRPTFYKVLVCFMFLRYKKDCVVLITLQNYCFFPILTIAFFMFCNIFCNISAIFICCTAYFCTFLPKTAKSTCQNRSVFAPKFPPKTPLKYDETNCTMSALETGPIHSQSTLYPANPLLLAICS